MKSYTFKKFKKQLLPYLLSFAIVLGAFSWKAPEADAIATEAVVSAIISVAIGSGLAFAVDRMTSPEVDAYWTGQAQQWLQSIGQSYSDFVDQAEQNMSAKDGKSNTTRIRISNNRSRLTNRNRVFSFPPRKEILN